MCGISGFCNFDPGLPYEKAALGGAADKHAKNALAPRKRQQRTVPL